MPASKRWPIRVELAKYADEIAGGGDVSLLQYIAQQITGRGVGNVTATQLHEWLRVWPWLLILDGLDEVAAEAAREHLTRALQDFFIDAHQVDADLVVVATTRPRGTEGEFDNSTHQHLTLQQLLARERALRYAKDLIHVRLGDDHTLAEQTLARVQDATQQQLTARLMGTPLQVTIMTLLLEQHPEPATGPARPV